MQQFHVESLGMMAHVFDSEHELKTMVYFMARFVTCSKVKSFHTLSIQIPTRRLSEV